MAFCETETQFLLSYLSALYLYFQVMNSWVWFPWLQRKVGRYPSLFSVPLPANLHGQRGCLYNRNEHSFQNYQVDRDWTGQWKQGKVMASTKSPPGKLKWASVRFVLSWNLLISECRQFHPWAHNKMGQKSTARSHLVCLKALRENELKYNYIT